MLNFINTYGLYILGILVVALFGWLGKVAKNGMDKIIDTKLKESIARTAAQFVEQAWKNLHGKDKLKKALETAAVLLRKKGIQFDAEEMEILIEAAVAKFNEAFAKKKIA
jgi:hypothetical protein